MYQVEVLRVPEMRRSSKIKRLLLPVTCMFGAVAVSGAADLLTTKVAELLRHLLIMVH